VSEIVEQLELRRGIVEFHERFFGEPFLRIILESGYTVDIPIADAVDFGAIAVELSKKLHDHLK
jgi:hypothetical protein